MSKEQIIDTRITDQWGVNWSPMEIARDFLQNFYDDNNVADINIDIKGKTVAISAPMAFDYKELIYMGSDKDESKIGQYGEGFKAATLNAMRDHKCKIKVFVKDYSLEFFFEEKIIGKAKKKIVMCKLLNTDTIKGTKLVIENCPSVLRKEFKFGLNYFYYEGNPLFGDLIAQSNNDIFFYKSKKEEGYVYYHKLLRAKLDIPLIIVCNRRYKTIDARIKHDRDRKAFDDNVKYQLIKSNGKAIHQNLHHVINYLEPYWAEGHKILYQFADGVGYRYKMEFPENYYANETTIRTRDNKDFNEKIVKWKHINKDFKECPSYFSHFGMQTVRNILLKQVAERNARYAAIFVWKPSKNQSKAIGVLSNMISELDFDLYSNFLETNYLIGDSYEILGELKSNKRKSKTVFLHKKMFTGSFGSALSLLLHEWAHIYGYDGSRGFSDALTHIINVIIENRDSLDSYEEEWNKLKDDIILPKYNDSEIEKINIKINSLSEKEKVKILKRIPEKELLKILFEEDIL